MVTRNQAQWFIHVILWEAEERDEFWVSLCCIVRPCLSKQQIKVGLKNEVCLSKTLPSDLLLHLPESLFTFFIDAWEDGSAGKEVC